MTKTNNQAGFSFLAVLVIAAVLSLSGLTLIGLLQTELKITGLSKRVHIAQAAAAGGTMETILRTDIDDSAPRPEDIAQVYQDVEPLADESAFGESNQRSSYESEVVHLRIASELESSQGLVRRAVTEVSTVGTFGDMMTAEIKAETVRIIPWDSARLIPVNHFQ